MTKPSNIAAIEETTKLSWDEWVTFLESINAKDLPHKEIAEKVHAKLEGSLENAGWWAQGVTVAYEQHIGRREPGQQNDGTYEISVSKTIDGTMDEALEKWIELTSSHKEFGGVALDGEPSWSETEKWRNWRCSLVDGTRVIVGINQKNPVKSGLGLAHVKIKHPDDAEKWREFWKEFVQDLS